MLNKAVLSPVYNTIKKRNWKENIENHFHSNTISKNKYNITKLITINLDT